MIVIVIVIVDCGFFAWFIHDVGTHWVSSLFGFVLLLVFSSCLFPSSASHSCSCCHCVRGPISHLYLCFSVSLISVLTCFSRISFMRLSRALFLARLFGSLPLRSFLRSFRGPVPLPPYFSRFFFVSWFDFILSIYSAANSPLKPIPQIS